MQTTIQYIEKELADLYPKSEIRGLIRIIFAFVFGTDFTGLHFLKLKDEKLNVDHQKKIEEIVLRLKHFEPIQYILGETEFFNLKLKVNPYVLIPRPETEELVKWMTETMWSPNPEILDVGTGSGCIALALKKQLPDARITAADISEQALQTASENAKMNRLDVEFFLFDILRWEKKSQPFYDGIVSNPPYVRESEKNQMLPNVLEFEPENALFVPDDDPLIFYRHIGKFAQHHLKSGGILFLEINEYLGKETTQLLKLFGFGKIELRKDIHGKDRMLKVMK